MFHAASVGLINLQSNILQLLEESNSILFHIRDCYYHRGFTVPVE